MTPTLDIRLGPALALLRAMPTASVHCGVTSPPYWMLRDYGADGQLGLEKTFGGYLRNLRAIFREFRRVLRPDGSLWMNMGDCYDPKKPKDLLGQPWKVAFALQADGWYLRQDIVWHKPNPAPESAKDRCTKAHEYLFLLTPSPRYYYDREAVMEPASANTNPRAAVPDEIVDPLFDIAAFTAEGAPGGVTPKAVAAWASGPGRHDTVAHARGSRIKNNPSFAAAVVGAVGDRNKRSVWTIPTQPTSEAHFATFPEDLVKPCILAGTSAAGCCSSCGGPYLREIRKGEPNLAHQRACGADPCGEYHGSSRKDYATARAQDASAMKSRILRGMVQRETIGWRPSCKCEDNSPVPAVVLDPFGGSGTTAKVALELGRSAILLEINPEYAEIARRRCHITPGFAFQEGGAA